MTTPNPYGYDLWHDGNDLDVGMRETGGNLVLAQWAVRCLQTPQGQLLDDPQYGYDLTQWVNSDVDITNPQLAQIKSGIVKALLRDERILDVQVPSIVLGPDNILAITIILTPSAGPFTLVLAVSATTVQLLQPTTG